jgi:hypothetical protein
MTSTGHPQGPTPSERLRRLHKALASMALKPVHGHSLHKWPHSHLEVFWVLLQHEVWALLLGLQSRGNRIPQYVHMRGLLQRPRNLFFFLYIFRGFCVYVPLPPLRGQHIVLCHPSWLPTSGLTEFAVCWGGAGRVLGRSW